jgi:hypothetical protein
VITIDSCKAMHLTVEEVASVAARMLQYASSLSDCMIEHCCPSHHVQSSLLLLPPPPAAPLLTSGKARRELCGGLSGVRQDVTENL